MNQELQDYIKKTREAGVSDEQIKQELLKVGWKAEDINQAFTDNVVPAPMPKLEIAGPKSKFKLFTIIAIVVIAIVLIGGGVLDYVYLIKPSAPKNALNDQKNQKENNEIPKSEIKDCGSIIDTHIFVSPNQLTQQEKDSLKCINEALVDCKLAKIEIAVGEENMSGSYKIEYEIKGEEGQNCLIIQKILQPASSKTCKIPMNFIADSKIAAENQNQSDMLFVLTIPFVFTFETTTNTQTGEVINFECQ